MPPVTTWNSKNDWLLWNNESPSGEVRIVDDKLKLPFNKISHLGLGSEASEIIARWRFGQNQSSVDDAENGHDASIPNNVNAEIVENGFLSPTRNGYVTVNESSSFTFSPAISSFYLSAWIKSNITDYSDRLGLIAGYHTGIDANQFSYSIIIDTDNKIKAFLRSGGSNVTLTPANGDVTIDTEWHHILLKIDNTNSEKALYVDNSFANQSNGSLLQALTGGEFNIGSSEYESEYGFSGLIDEVVLSLYTPTTGSPLVDNVVSHRFNANNFISPVIDTERDNSILSVINAEFENSNNSLVLFSFRASDTSFEQDDYIVEWSGFTVAGQIKNKTNIELSDLGLFVQGRFQQVRIRLIPSTVNSSISDPLQVSSPALSSLTVNYSLPSIQLTPSELSFQSGVVLGQTYNFTGNKTIHKVSLGLSINSKERTLFIVGSEGNVSFQAANFQFFKDNWVWQPSLHWKGPEWKTSGITIENKQQDEFYSDTDDIILNAPYLSYIMFLDGAGEYDIWGYGFVPNPGIVWSWDNDTDHLRNFTLGQDDSAGAGIPRWTKIGRIYTKEGGIHTFTVYLTNIEGVKLDQWFITQNLEYSDLLETIGETGYTTPIPNSKAPFNTALRLRPLTDDSIIPLTQDEGITAWVPSNEIVASGLANYPIQDNSFAGGVTFTNGLSIEYWQIGGGLNDFAAWNKNFNKTSSGQAFSSDDFGQNYVIEI